MITDTKRLHKRQLFCRQAPPAYNAFDWHGDVFTKTAVPLYSHRLIVFTAIDEPPLARIACAAVEIRIGRYDVAGFQSSFILPDFYDLRTKFMPRNPRICSKRLIAGITGDICAADSAIENAQQSFALPNIRFLHFRHLNVTRFLNPDCFHHSLSSPSLI